MKFQPLKYIALAVLFCTLSVSARAQVFTYTGTLTITSGTLSAYTTVTLNTEIKDVMFWVPTLDAASTVTLGLSQKVFGVNDTAIRGWTDKDVGATGDNAVVSANSSVLELYVNNPVRIKVTCYDAQAADRVFKWIIRTKY